MNQIQSPRFPDTDVKDYNLAMVSTWVLKSKLESPRSRPPTLHRARAMARLAQGLNTQFTVVQASAGYGKSTTVTAFLKQRPEPGVWYSVDKHDLDPLIFSAHLITGFESLAPGIGSSLSPLFLQAQRGDFPWSLFIDALNNYLLDHMDGDAWLVLDDLHVIANGESPLSPLVDRFLAYAPPPLHIIITTRHWTDLPSLTQARAHGHLLSIGERDLAFTQSEIDVLLRQYHDIPLRSEHVRRLSAETEGWVMALQLLARQLRGLPIDQVDATLSDLPLHLDALFDYLTDSIIRQQPPAVEHFLYQTSILQHLQVDACNAVYRTHDSANLLGEVQNAGLCLVQIDETTYRHHYLVHEFLRRQLRRDRTTWRRLNRRAAVHYSNTGSRENSIHHLIEAGDFETAALQITAIAESLIHSGRFSILADWLDQLPDHILDDQPDLRIIQGDVARLTSLYDDALRAYLLAEANYAAQGDVLGRSQALESQALVYIDTVRPVPAETLIKQSLRVLKRRNPSESARLLRLLAENAANRGRSTLAARWYSASQKLGAAADIELEARIRLRSGELDAAQALLEPVGDQVEIQRPARTHRERSLLLAFLQALNGQTEDARINAQSGLDLGRRLNSPFTEAVAHMRLGHAWQLPPLADHELAFEHYTESIRLMRLVGVGRGEAEPQFGLALLHAHARRPGAALVAAERSLQIAERAGDAWVVGLARLAKGISLFLQDEFDDSHMTLKQALSDMEACADSFGVTLAHLWLSLLAFQTGSDEDFALHTIAWLDAAESYPFLLDSPTLFGSRDPQQLVPLLLHARRLKNSPRIVSRLLNRQNLSATLDYHPGYTLRVQMLGGFQVWRGDILIRNREWRRKSARNLLQLLLINQGRFLHREQISGQLWPDAEPDAADNLFKVTLNALQHVLEPDRPRGSPAFVIRRRESAYGINRAAVIESDISSFERMLRRASRQQQDDPQQAIFTYRQALNLYQSDFLPGAVYDEWTGKERQRLQTLFLHSAETLSRLILREAPDEAVLWCERILSTDPCWEPAYRLAMRAYALQGQRHLLARSYQRCVDTLREEYDLPPMPETVNLYHNLVHGIWPDEGVE